MAGDQGSNGGGDDADENGSLDVAATEDDGDDESEQGQQSALVGKIGDAGTVDR